MKPSDDYRLAARMATVEPSPFLAVLQTARIVEARGKRVVYLSVGEPDFLTPLNRVAILISLKTGRALPVSVA